MFECAQIIWNFSVIAASMPDTSLDIFNIAASIKMY